jgi:hypothetical protein
MCLLENIHSRNHATDTDIHTRKRGSRRRVGRGGLLKMRRSRHETYDYKTRKDTKTNANTKTRNKTKTETNAKDKYNDKDVD